MRSITRTGTAAASNARQALADFTLAVAKHFERLSGKASGAKPFLVCEAIADLMKCWVSIVLLRRA